MESTRVDSDAGVNVHVDVGRDSRRNVYARRHLAFALDLAEGAHALRLTTRYRW